MNCIENHFSEKIRSHYKDRIATHRRTANLSRGWNGRGPCQYRNLCSRGCPFAGYFSSNAATLPAAASTGNLTLLPDSIVIEVMYDSKSNRASGVKIMNAHTKEVTEYYARIIFLNASSIATAAILLNSVSSSFPTGMGNSSGRSDIISWIILPAPGQKLSLMGIRTNIFLDENLLVFTYHDSGIFQTKQNVRIIYAVLVCRVSGEGWAGEIRVQECQALEKISRNNYHRLVHGICG